MTAAEVEPGNRRLATLGEKGPRKGSGRLTPSALLALLGRAWLPLGLLATAVAVKGLEARGALLYPDGYQYLLMARGISEHLRPILRLGQGGELFIPDADAALKPLFPAAVALVHLGAGWATAARLVTVGAGGAAIALCGLVASRLTSSRVLGAFAGLVVLLDPTERYWAAFSSPDQLGQALTFGAVLAILTGKHRVAGALAGLALLARPELGLLLLAAAVALLATATHRHVSLGFLTVALTVVGLVLAVLRPPLQLDFTEVAVAIGGSVAAAAVALLPSPRIGVAVGLAGLAFAIARAPALSGLARHDLLLALFFAGGLLLARDTRPAAVLAVAAGALAVIYGLKNGSSTRYAAELLPLSAVGAAVGIGRVSHRLGSLGRGVALGVAAATGAAAAAAAPPSAPGPDMFGTVAGSLPLTAQPIFTSAPDAYGFLLYPRPVRSLAPGSRGLLLVDATTRAYEPRLRTRGRIVTSLPVGDGFLDPDGSLDRTRALLIDGAARDAAPA